MLEDPDQALALGAQPPTALELRFARQGRQHGLGAEPEAGGDLFCGDPELARERVDRPRLLRIGEAASAHHGQPRGDARVERHVVAAVALDLKLSLARWRVLLLLLLAGNFELVVQ